MITVPPGDEQIETLDIIQTQENAVDTVSTPVPNTDPITTSAGLNFQSRAPNTSSRQRSSNESISNAETEFLKTALSSCRSTISQQEMELKRLRETLDIRNKRIIQLEQVVGHATEDIASRDQHHMSDSITTTETIILRLNDIVNRLDMMKANDSQSTNNIVINAYSATSQASKLQSSTQTDLSDNAGLNPVTENIYPDDPSIQSSQPHIDTLL